MAASTKTAASDPTTDEQVTAAAEPAVDVEAGGDGLNEAAKDWIRREIDLAMQGHGPQERKTELNP